MKNIKNKKLFSKFIILALASVVFVSALSLTGCSQTDNSNAETNPLASDSLTEELEMMNIETPYCTMQYPAVWSDYLEVYDSVEDNVFTYQFFCYLNGKQMELFDVYFGDTQEGVIIGYLEKDENKVAFSVKGSDTQPDASLSDKDRDTFSMMAEGINYIISSVKEADNFSEEQ